ncbi:MAG: cyclic lactone autoinducer peptide [Oscillospiraceae bacterium]|jgi:cyclic lactone autoinducer peptide|nr:cyclic lactone autoinducer peptide [Oscillospiraceae bacterium]
MKKGDFTKKAARIASRIILVSASAAAVTACSLAFYQPKLPANIKQRTGKK